MLIPALGFALIYILFSMYSKGTVSSFAFLSYDFLFYVVICFMLFYIILSKNNGGVFKNSSDDYRIIDEQFNRFNDYYKMADGTKSELKKLVSRIERKDFISNDKSRIVDCIEMLFETSDNSQYLIIYDITNSKIRRGMNSPIAPYRQIPFYDFDIENYKRRPYDYQNKGTVINMGNNKDKDKEAFGKKEEDDTDGKSDKS